MLEHNNHKIDGYLKVNFTLRYKLRVRNKKNPEAIDLYEFFHISSF